MNDTPPTLYVDRRTGAVVQERVFGGQGLWRLYHTRFGRLVTWNVLVKRPFHWLYGALQRGPWSKYKIESFVSSLGIDATEAALPLDAYDSLDAFFTRHLKPGARPIDGHPRHLVSPADARVLAYDRIGNRLPTVKGRPVSLAALLGGETLASRYDGGAAFVFRLAPADYHRFHFPASGEASAPTVIDGALHSVHPVALEGGAPSFDNARVITWLSTSEFGQVALVDVGALLVGTIVQTYTPGAVERGSEKGFFRFGGSTVVLLAEPGAIAIDEDLLANTSRGLETRVLVGTRIATALR